MDVITDNGNRDSLQDKLTFILLISINIEVNLFQFKHFFFKITGY